MAEERDAPNSRLLFTDLDVSDKGRPLPGAPAPASPFATPLTSIAELASSLELDFEDDEGEDEFRHRRQSNAAAEAATPAKRAYSAEDDPELDLLADRLSHREIYQPAFPELAQDGSASVPTWEEFTSAFRAASEEDAHEDDPLFPSHRWRGHRRSEYGFEGEADEDWDDPLLEEDIDILSAIEADELERYDAEEDAALDDEEEEFHHANSSATQVINPRERLAALELAAAEGDADAARPSGQADLDDDADFFAEPSAERPGAETSVMNPADTIYNMFSDIDIDTLWKERIEKKKRAASSKHGKADSRVMDQFDEVDLEAMWEERKKNAPKRNSARFPELAADETIILKPDALDATSTVIMRPDEILAATARRDSKRAAPKKKASAPPTAAVSPASAPSSAPSSAANVAPELDDAEFAVDVDGMLEPRDTLPVKPLVQVVQPEVSDEEAFGDLQSLLDPEPKNAAGEESEWLPGGDDAEAQEQEDAGAEAQGQAEVEARTEAPTHADAGPGGHVFTPGIGATEITTDDVINDIDLDGEDAVNHDVSAPVIDDSAITRVRGPRPGTEEMQAIMGTYDESEDGEAGEAAEAAEGEGAAEGEAAEEAVAVNPMDVFANMDDMDFDFSDDMDDEMRAMLDDDEDEAAEGAETAEGGAEGEADAAPTDEPPPGRLGKLLWRAGKLARRYLPAKALTLFDKVAAMVAWRENWWFYCDLLAAIIASASLAVIISYYVWYRK